MMGSKAQERAGINWASKRSFLVFMSAEWQPGLFLEGPRWVPFLAAGFLRSESDPAHPPKVTQEIKEQLFLEPVV